MGEMADEIFDQAMRDEFLLIRETRKTRQHICKESRTCKYSSSTLTPNDDCPVHGTPWPPRCEECGRFLSKKGKEK